MVYLNHERDNPMPENQNPSLPQPDDQPDSTTPNTPLPYDDLSASTAPHPSTQYTDPLARASAYEPTEPLGDETDDYIPSQIDSAPKPVTPPKRPSYDVDVPFDLPKADDVLSDKRNDPHKMVTMPIFKEPGVTDPRITLPGSGGLDPSPDAPYSDERTVANMPSVTMVSPSMSQETIAQSTMPQDVRWQRPDNQANVQAFQGGYMPPPPANNQKPLPQRRPMPRRIVGLRPGCFYAIVGLLLTMCGGLTFLGVASVAIFIPYIENRWEGELSRVDNYQSFQSTFINDRYGNRLFEAFNEGKRIEVEYSRFPQQLIEATIAIEDDSFWTNLGIDVPATTVAFLKFVGADSGENTPGGSTITQQLVRNVLFDPEKRSERSAQRKLEEIILAVLLTQRKGKEDIMTMYLNEIYYGNLSYGAQTAAQTLFSKNVEDLTLGEAALLAGLPQAPADLDPLNPDPEVQERVYNRQRQVLEEMVQEGYITSEQRNEALAQGLTFNPQQTSLKAPHFTVYAQKELQTIMQGLGYSPADIARGGFTVYTTIDQDVNNMALLAAQTQVAKLAGNRVSNGAVLVLQPTTGEILAMVGSLDYDSQVIDGRVNVTTALRQPGSTMKAFTYAAAIERGMTPGDVIWDTPTDIGIPGQPMYTPKNYDGTFHGPVFMRGALANSYNIPAVQTLRLVGVDYLLDFMRRFGTTSLSQDASQYGLSLTLGGGEVSLVELTAGYGVFANQGAYVEPTSILCVLDNNNNIVYQYENGCPTTATLTAQSYDRPAFGRQVLDPRIAYIITDMLGDNGARTPAMGGNSVLNTPRIQTSVKTGTTNDYKDNWTVGYTSNVVVGVWTGNNDGTPMANVSGLAGAAPIWNSVINTIYATPSMLNAFAVGGQLVPDKPQPPSGMTLKQICDVRRLSDPSSVCPSTVNEWFLEGGVGIPDGEGNLQYQPAPQLPASSGYIQYVSPSVYQAYVVALPPNVGATVSFQINPANGDKQPPTPKYCLVPDGFPLETPGIQDLLFIQGPTTSQGDAAEAERWAQARGLAYMPTVQCPSDLSGLAGGVNGSGIVNTAVITSPSNGQTVSGNTAIFGTAQYDPSTVVYYHIFIKGGPFADWTPLGNPGTNSVVNGQLEVLQASGLPAGQYGLRLALIAPGGVFAQPPYDITITVQ
jgi:penicillin-binding protein 1C